MELLAYGALAFAALVAVACVVLLARRTGAGSGEAESLRAQLAAVQRERAEAADARARAETRLETAEQRISQMSEELAEARSMRDAALQRAGEAEHRSGLARQQMEDIEKRVSDWEQAKKESIEAAKAGALASARELAAQLIEGHKRENEAAKKESEERVQKVTENLHQTFQTVVQSVHALSKDVGESRSTIETVMRSLTSPGGAGQFAEIGLENTLKGFGLQAGRDFVMQHSTTGEDGRRLRPDAVVFLPGDAALVIDCKASKFVMDLAEAESTPAEADAYAGLARTMNQHLRALVDKDYTAAIREMYGAAGRAQEFRQITMAMYLPSEAAVEKLERADPEFGRRASQQRIVPVGPAGLRGLIGLSSVRIDLGRQAENQDRIVEATRALLDSIGDVLGHAESIGKGIKSAADNYSKLVGSVNKRLLPRSRKLVDLGVRPGKQKKLPHSLNHVEVIVMDQAQLIEADASPDETATSDDEGLRRPRLVGQSDDE